MVSPEILTQPYQTKLIDGHTSEFNRPVRPGTTQDGMGCCHAVRPRVGQKGWRLFEARWGQTETMAGDGEEPSPVVIHRYP